MKLLEVLKEAGCHPRNYGSYLTCSAKYRGGNDPGSVGVYLNKNIAKDFVTGKTFSIEDFLKETLGIKDPSRLNSILSENGSYFCLDQSEVDPFQNVVRYFSDNEIEKLKADTSYWENRGISNF